MKIMQSTLKKNQGLSLIEMMISMVLGLFLVLGLTTMYLSSKKTDKVRDAVSNIEENARLALNVLRASIEHAGYKSIDNIYIDNPFQVSSSPAISNPNCSDNEALITNADLMAAEVPTEMAGYTGDGNVAGNESDHLTVIYRADNPDRGSIFFDCSGKTGSYEGDEDRQKACSTDSSVGFKQPQNALIYNGLYVDSSDKTLRCIGSRGTGGSIVLANNIENMQVLYGVFKDNATIFKKASDVNASTNEWEAVTSVQVAILVSSERSVLEQTQEHKITLLDEEIEKEDKKLYRAFSTTIHLPNRSRRELQTVTRVNPPAGKDD